MRASASTGRRSTKIWAPKVSSRAPRRRGVVSPSAHESRVSAWVAGLKRLPSGSNDFGPNAPREFYRTSQASNCRMSHGKRLNERRERRSML